MQNDFSVVIPTRGNRTLLRPTLAAALASRDAEFEVVLVHDRRAGEPKLPGDVTGDPRVRVVASRGPGLATARNTGIDAAAGRYVSFLDDDDIWSPDHLRQAAETLDREADAVLVASASRMYFDPTEDGSGPVPADSSALPRWPRSPADGEVGLRTLLLGNAFPPASVTVVRERLRGERFATDLPTQGLEDWDLWLRLARIGRLVFDSRPTLVMRMRRGSMSRNWRGMATCALEVLSRQVATGIPPGTISDAELRSVESRLWHDLAYACLVEDDRVPGRAALGEAIRRDPARMKNYAYWLGSRFPRAIGSWMFGRGRKILAANR